MSQDGTWRRGCL